MLKKITVSILTIMLMAGMFLGAAGAVIPEPVHAEDSGYYEVSLTINTILDEGGIDASGKIQTFFHVNAEGKDSSEVRRYLGENATTILSSLETCPDSFDFYLTFGGDYYKNPITVQGVDETYTGEWVFNHPAQAFDQGRFTCKYTYKVTHFHSKDKHKWTYTADGNVITAKCTAPNECPLEAPTLTINASDKTYDGKPAAFALTPNSTWTSQRFDIPELFPAPENSIKAGKYNANCTVYGVTAEKRFTINPRGVLVGGVKVENKEYDGTTKAIVDTSKAGILGVLEGDEVGLSVTGEYEDPEEGPDKNVHLTYTLTGADAGNYYVTDSPTSPATVKASIYVKGNGGPDDYDEDSDKKGGSSKSSPIPDPVPAPTPANGSAAAAAAAYSELGGIYDGSMPVPKKFRVTAYRKGVKASWNKFSKKKKSRFSRVEIQVSASGDFTDAKVRDAEKTAVSKKVGKLRSRKTYYVRARTCKVAGGVKYVSAWSKVKRVKTR